MLLEWIAENNFNCSQLPRSQLQCEKENTIILHGIKYKNKNKMQRVQRWIFFVWSAFKNYAMDLEMKKTHKFEGKIQNKTQKWNYKAWEEENFGVRNN